jgi:hypothetical protein
MAAVVYLVNDLFFAAKIEETAAQPGSCRPESQALDLAER